MRGVVRIIFFFLLDEAMVDYTVKSYQIFGSENLGWFYRDSFF